MVSCVFPGSFDPVTKGHLDLISRAASMFDHVTVAVMINPHKKCFISAEKRAELLRKLCGGYANVTVDLWDGLLVDYLRQKGESIILRGLRSAAEYEQEMLSAEANSLLYRRATTLFIPCSPSLAGISSSAVREIHSFGGDISAFVPPGLREDILALLSNN